MKNHGRKLKKGRCFLVLCVLLMMINICSNGVAALAENRQKEYVEIMVYKGDTLWDIAADNCDSGESIRSMIHEIKKENGLSGDMIKAGDILRIPLNQ